MIPLPSDATQGDVDQWCNRGVVMATLPDGSIVPMWYTGCSSRRTVTGQTFTGRDVGVPADGVFVHWPRCGSVNLPNRHYAVHAERRTQRQYRRTWHAAGLNVVTPRAWDVAKFSGGRPNDTNVPARELAEACFNPTYPTFSEADELITSEKKVTVALTPRVIMAGDKSGKRMFYYNGVLAATASDGMLHPAGLDIPVRKIAKLLEGRYYVAQHS